LSIRGDDDVLDKVVVSSQTSLCSSVVLFFSGKIPLDEGLISGSREEHVWVFIGGSKAGNPTSVSLQNSSKMNVSFGHDD